MEDDKFKFLCKIDVYAWNTVFIYYWTIGNVGIKSSKRSKLSESLQFPLDEYCALSTTITNKY